MINALKEAGIEKNRPPETLFFLSDSYAEFVSDEQVLRIWDKGQNVHISLAIDGEEAISPVRASFGGFDRITDVRSMSSVLDRMENILKEKGVKAVSVRLHPAVYDSASFRAQLRLFLQHGYHIAYVDINQHISVSGYCPFKPKERAVLRRNLSLGLMGQPEEVNALEEAYAVLKESRARKGFPVTMDFDSLEASFLRFPERYRLFTVRHSGRMVAMAVCIRISPKILYHFYHADVNDYTHFSPTVSLVDHIRKYALSRDIPVMDLGISTEAGKLNHNLYRFKRRLGAVDSPKPMLKKVL